MHTHIQCSIVIAGISLASGATLVSGCAPRVEHETVEHPANPEGPVGDQQKIIMDLPAQELPSGQTPAGGHAGHDQHANEDGHAGHSGHTGHDQHARPGQPVASAEAMLAAERAAYERAKPVFDKYCAKCHTSSGAKASKKAMSHFSMDTYPFGGHHATEIGDEIRKALGVTAKEPTMPRDRPGVVEGDELARVLAWADAFDAAHAAGLHDHGTGHQHGDHGPEQGHGHGHQH